jgi:hypothetical protein
MARITQEWSVLYNRNSEVRVLATSRTAAIRIARAEFNYPIRIDPKEVEIATFNLNPMNCVNGPDLLQEAILAECRRRIG